MLFLDMKCQNPAYIDQSWLFMKLLEIEYIWLGTV